MKEYTKTHDVSCCRYCPFRKSDGHQMYCGHPKWETDPNPYGSSIVSQFTLDSFPKECPLFEEDFKQINIYKVKQ